MAGVTFLITLIAFYVCGDNPGVSGKFRNLTNRKLRLFWVNHQRQPYLNSLVRAGQEVSFATYVPHEFFWAELRGPEVPVTRAGVQRERFRIEQNKVIYCITDETTPKEQVEELEEELDFMKGYVERTGRQWIGPIPRDPPIYKFKEAPHVGHTELVELDEPSAKWLCGDEANPECRAKPEPLTLEVIATRPRAFVVHEFLSDFECERIIEFHRSKLTRSTTGNGENAKQESVRSSLSARMGRDVLEVSDAIYRRLAKLVDLPEELLTENGISEAFNIVNYQVGQQYTPHFDTGVGDKMESRFISAILYFNTPTGGGATSFPAAPTEDGGQGVYVEATKRSVMFFYDLLEDGNFDEFSLHAGEPVTEGEKWIAAAWLWEPAISKPDKTFVDKYKTSTVESLFDAQGKPKKQHQQKTEL